MKKIWNLLQTRMGWGRLYGEWLDTRRRKSKKPFSWSSGSIWGIAILLHLILFWSLKDWVMFRYGNGALERLKRTFFVYELETPPDAPGGNVTREVFYTVPTKLVETSTKQPETPVPPLTVDPILSLMPKPEEPKIVSGGPSTVRVRGMQMTTRRIIFLVDASGSMWNSIDGKSLRTRFDLAREEVMKGIDQLGPDVTFNVLYFADGVASLSPVPIRATEESKQRAANFLRETPSLSGGTEFLKGLQVALDMKPDSLLVVSDGFSNVPNWRLMRQFQETYRNTESEAQIYSIGLAPPSEKDQNELLQKLAKLTGGLFVPVPVSEPQKAATALAEPRPITKPISPKPKNPAP